MRQLGKLMLIAILVAAAYITVAYQPVIHGAVPEGCASCSGRLEVPCSKCRGRRTEPVQQACGPCKGTGKGEWKLAAKSTGAAHPPNCIYCAGRGVREVEVTCGKCSGSGGETCSVCGGHRLGFGYSLLERALVVIGRQPRHNPKPFVVPLVSRSTLAEAYVRGKSSGPLRYRLTKVVAPMRSGDQWVLPIKVSASDGKKHQQQEWLLTIMDRQVVAANRRN